MTHISETLAAYDALAPAYAAYSGKRQAYLDAVDSLVVERFPQGARWLDVGSGDGRRLGKIRAAVLPSGVVAIEPSTGMGAICARDTGVVVHSVTAGKMDSLDIGTFDVVTVLWNVFGHIAPMAERIKSLRNIAAKMNSGAVLIMDVNNRHNAAAYGRAKVFGRVIIDTLAFDERRGDAVYDWVIAGHTFKGSGHLFTPQEMAMMFDAAGLRVRERLAVDYTTGVIGHSPFQGQLFYVLEKKSGT